MSVSIVSCLSKGDAVSQFIHYRVEFVESLVALKAKYLLLLKSLLARSELFTLFVNFRGKSAPFSCVCVIIEKCETR